MSKLKELLAQNKNKYKGNNGARAFKFPEGKTRIRIIQTKPGEKFWRDVGVHWIKADRGGKPISVIGCNDVVHEKHCEVCAAIEKSKIGVLDEEDEKLIKEWGARKDVLVPALVLGADKKFSDPQIVQLTPTTFGQVLSIAEEFDMDDINIFDIEDGRDLIVERTGKGLDTEYQVMVAPKSLKIDSSVASNLPDIDAWIESNFFNETPNKAVTAIAQITGTTVATLESKSVNTKMLADASVDDDEINLDEEIDDEVDEVEEKKTESKSKSKTEDLTDIVDDSEIDDILSDLEDMV